MDISVLAFDETLVLFAVIYQIRMKSNSTTIRLLLHRLPQLVLHNQPHPPHHSQHRHVRHLRLRKHPLHLQHQLQHQCPRQTCFVNTKFVLETTTAVKDLFVEAEALSPWFVPEKMSPETNYPITMEAAEVEDCVELRHNA